MCGKAESGQEKSKRESRSLLSTLSFRVLSADGVLQSPLEVDATLTTLAADTSIQDRYQLIRELGAVVWAASIWRKITDWIDWWRSRWSLGPRPLGSVCWRMLSCARAAGAGLNHPAIAAVYDFGFHEGHAFTVFEYVDGDSLRDLLRSCPRMGLAEVRTVVGSLARALDFAHSRGIVHRDLKPENIRASKQGQFKILDLGLAQEFRLNREWGIFAGTPAYASPEQAAGVPADGRSDQYALAVIAYEMLVGCRPLRAR